MQVLVADFRPFSLLSNPLELRIDLNFRACDWKGAGCMSSHSGWWVVGVPQKRDWHGNSMKGKEGRNIYFPSSSLHISYALPSLIFNKRERQASDRRQLDVYMFAFLPSGYAHILRQIVIRLETVSSTNLFALRHREKARHLVPLGWRASLTRLM